MNTVSFQLNDRQYDQLMEMVGYGKDWMELTGEAAFREGTPYDALVEALESTKSYLWTSSSGTLELEIPAQAVEDIARPAADNEPACREWLDPNNTNYLQAQLRRLDMDEARLHLEDAGIDGVQEKSDEEVLMYVIWMACHDVNDEKGRED